MPDRHPAMLYRPGTETVIWGHRLDTLIVADEAAEEVAVAEGWSRTPPPEDEPPAAFVGAAKTTDTVEPVVRKRRKSPTRKPRAGKEPS